MTENSMESIRANLKDRILRDGPYSEEENLRIYEKWFKNSPRYVFRAINEKYKLTDKIMCDVGCGYGMNLVYGLPESYGVDVNTYYAEFARSLGITVYIRDLMHDEIDDLPKVDAIWCSAVLEHVESPHIFLRRLASMLNPNGLLVIYVPSIPLVPPMRRIRRIEHLVTGYVYGDHINAFVPSTLQFTCERAGFETLEVSPFFPKPISFLSHVPIANRIIDGCAYIGRKVPNWEYPPKAERVATEDTFEKFVYKDSFQKAK